MFKMEIVMNSNRTNRSCNINNRIVANKMGYRIIIWMKNIGNNSRIKK